MRIVSVTAEPFHTPLHNPFVTSQGSTISAQAVAIMLALEDGRAGRGESVPVRYVTGETIETVENAVDEVTPRLVGLDVTAYRRGFQLLADMLPDAPSARCGLEMALLDCWSKTLGVSLAALWGGALTAVETDLTIPIVPNAGELTELAWGLGVRVFKVKVGEANVEEDHARILAVRQAAPGARIRIDANQAFTAEQALAFVDRLLNEGANIEMLEQPVPREDIDGLAKVADACPVPVFADESVRTQADALSLATTTNVHGFNLKINKNGIAGVLDIIGIARAAGRKLMLGCMLETRYSIFVALSLACGTGAFDLIDLDSHLLLNESGPNPWFHQEGGWLLLERSVDDPGTTPLGK